jgi:hypothetical protein
MVVPGLTCDQTHPAAAWLSIPSWPPYRGAGLPGGDPSVWVGVTVGELDALEPGLPSVVAPAVGLPEWPRSDMPMAIPPPASTTAPNATSVAVR